MDIEKYDLEQHNADDDIALLKQYINTTPASDEVKQAVLACLVRIKQSQVFASKMTALSRLHAQSAGKSLNSLSLGIDLLVHDLKPEFAADLPKLLAGLYSAYKADGVTQAATLSALARHLFPMDEDIQKAYPHPEGGPKCLVFTSLDDMPADMRAAVQRVQRETGDDKG